MNKTVWKYPFEITDEFELNLPIGARVLTAQMQNGVPCFWVEVDPRAEKWLRKFFVVGTGHPMGNWHGRYISTIQDGYLVWHIYELI